MSRPGMRFVPIKSAESQAKLTLLGVRDLLIKQRTMLVNAMRGHAAEFGVIAAKGRVKVAELVQRATAEDACAPALAREMLRVLSGQIDAPDRCARSMRQIDALEARLKALEGELMALHKADPVSSVWQPSPASVQSGR